jgi:hypothetical protein
LGGSRQKVSTGRCGLGGQLKGTTVHCWDVVSAGFRLARVDWAECGSDCGKWAAVTRSSTRQRERERDRLLSCGPEEESGLDQVAGLSSRVRPVRIRNLILDFD